MVEEKNTCFKSTAPSKRRSGNRGRAMWRVLPITGVLLVQGLFIPAAIVPEARANSEWLTTTDSDFNGTGSSFVNCVINGTGAYADIRLKTYSDWVQRAPFASPTARQSASMTSIGSDDKCVLFGGWDWSSDPVRDDTWVYDIGDNQWKEMSPANKPSPRGMSALATIFNDDRAVLFGGWPVATPRPFLNDTWIYNLTADEWYDASPEPHPSPRCGHAMASVQKSNKVVLFGGQEGWNHQGPTNNSNETWIYDIKDNKWTQMFPQNSPSPRFGHAMATIWNSDKVVLFGGSANEGYVNDTWIYDLRANQWYRDNPTVRPDASNWHCIGSSCNDDKILLYGGRGIPDPAGTWVYDLSDRQWTKMYLDHQPHPVERPAMASTPGNNKIVMFGGYDYRGAVLSGDTWVYDNSLYPWTGEYCSPYLDTGGNSSYYALNWTALVPQGTSLRFQLRTGANGSDFGDFVGPNGDINSYYTDNFSIYDGHKGDRWIQYKAYLKTNDNHLTPVLKEMVIGYDRFPSAPELLGPLNGAWTNNSHPTFRWAFNDSDSLMIGGSEFQIGSAPEDNSMDIIYNTGQNITSFSPEEALGEGFWYWRVRTQDAEGEWGAFSAYNKLGVDLSPPRPFSPDATPAEWTNDQCKVYFSTIDDFSGIDAFLIWIDNESFGAQRKPFLLPCNLTDGAHTVLVRAYDKAGNYADAKVRVFIDRTPPEPFTPAVTASYWANTSLRIGFNTTDAASGIVRYAIGIDSGSFETQSSPYILPDLGDGAHNVTVRAFDAAGNCREASLVVFIDKGIPENLVVSVSPPGWSTTAPSITFFANDPTSGIDRYEVMVDNGTFVNRTSPFVPDDMADGIHAITVRAYDLAGNFAEREVEAMMDGTPPEAFSPSADPSGWTLRDPVISFCTTDATSGVKYYLVGIDGGELSRGDSPLTVSDLPEGEHEVTIRAMDGAGNSRDAAVKLKIDRTPPDDVFVHVRNGDGTTATRKVSLTITARDNLSGLREMCFSNDGYIYSLWEPFSSNKNWTLTAGSGDKTVHVKVRDNTGNEAHSVSVIFYEPAKAIPFPMGVAVSLVIIITFIVMAVIFISRWRYRKRQLRNNVSSTSGKAPNR